MSELIDLIRRIEPEAEISHEDAQLPFPESLENRELRRSFSNIYQTPLEAGVASTIQDSRRCLEAGLIS